MRKLFWTLVFLFAFIGVLSAAVATYQYKDNTGSTFNILLWSNCGTAGRFCTGMVMEDTSGNEKATTANPATIDTGATGNLINAINASIPAGGNTIGNVNVLSSDPCLGAAKTNFPLSSATSNTQVVGGVSSKKVYICSISLIVAGAVVVNFIEGTGAACLASNEAAVIGSTTAANGLSLTTNGGLTLGNGAGTVAVTATAANGICILQSGTTSLAGNVTYVQQ